MLAWYFESGGSRKLLSGVITAVRCITADGVTKKASTFVNAF